MPLCDRHGRRTRVGALALALLAGIAACQWLVPLDADGPALHVDAGPPDPCGPVPPPPPGLVDAGDSVPVITLAAYYLGYDKGDAGFVCDNSGLNLDGLDSPKPTCKPAACTAPGGAGGTNQAACDGPNGADNALVILLSQLAPVVGATNLDAFSLTTALQRGVLNLLFQIRNYNGLPDDDDLQVLVWTSSGITGLPQDGGFSYQEIQALPEVWDGGQEDVEWTIDERSAITEGQVVSPKVVTGGYVKDEILVVPHTGPLSLPPLFGSSLAISDGILTGHLFRDKAGRWQLTFGRIAARAESSSILGVVGTAKIGAAGDTALCAPGNGFYQLARTTLCGSLDLPPEGGPPDTATTCGALSLGFALASVESKITMKELPNGFTEVVTGESRLQGAPLCVDDAGLVFCDDCAWAVPGKCDDAGRRVE